MYQTIAETSHDQGLYQEALRYYRLSIEEALKRGPDGILVTAFSNIIGVAHELGKLQQEVPLLEKVIRHYATIKDKTGLQEVYNYSIDLYQAYLAEEKGDYLITDS